MNDVEGSAVEPPALVPPNFGAEHSVWLAHRTDHERAATAPPRHARTVVIGGGIAGMSAAWALAEVGDPPVVLEAHTPACGASGRNAGFVLAEGPSVHAGDGQPEVAMRAFGLVTRARLGTLAQTSEFGYVRTGSLRLAHDAREAESFRQAVLPEGVRVVAGDDLPPPWNDGRWPAGRIDEGDGIVDPAALVEALEAAARDRGAQVFTGVTVEALRTDAAHVEVRAGAHTLTAERVVVATNAWTARLCPDIAIRPRRAQMLEATVAPALTFAQPVYARGGHDYWRALPNGRLIVGGCRDAGGEAEATDAGAPSAAVQDALDTLLHRLVGSRRATVTRRWAGIMGFTPDGLPFVGPREADSRVWLFAGFHGHGVGWAPGLAPLLARGIVDGAAEIPSAFRPGPRDVRQ